MNITNFEEIMKKYEKICQGNKMKIRRRRNRDRKQYPNGSKGTTRKVKEVIKAPETVKQIKGNFSSSRTEVLEEAKKITIHAEVARVQGTIIVCKR